jgi:hypothetical protein
MTSSAACEGIEERISGKVRAADKSADLTMVSSRYGVAVAPGLMASTAWERFLTTDAKVRAILETCQRQLQNVAKIAKLGQTKG